MNFKKIFLLFLSFNPLSFSYTYPKNNYLKENFKCKMNFICKMNFKNINQKIINKKDNFMNLIRSENIFPTLLLSFSGNWISNPSFTNLLKNKVFIISNIVTILIMSSSMIINDIIDINIDKINSPNKPLVNGSISINEAVNYLLLLLLLTELLSFRYLTKVMNIITNLSILNILLYTPIFKKITFLKNLSCAFLVSYSVIFSALSSNSDLTNNILLKTLFTTLFYGSFHNELLLDINDQIGDKINGINSVPVVYGNEKSVNILLFLNISVLIYNSYLLNKYYGLKIALLFPILFLKLFFDLLKIKKNNYEKVLIRNIVKESSYQLFLILLYYCINAYILRKSYIFN